MVIERKSTEMQKIERKYEDRDRQLSHELEELQDHELKIGRDCKRFIETLHNSGAWQGEAADRFHGNLEFEVMENHSAAKKALYSRYDEIEKERTALKQKMLHASDEKESFQQKGKV